jgi:hypothetical protein
VEKGDQLGGKENSLGKENILERRRTASGGKQL